MQFVIVVYKCKGIIIFDMPASQHPSFLFFLETYGDDENEMMHG